MNKKFFRIALLCALLGTGAAVTSCTDYDQEIADLQESVSALEKKVSDIQAAINAGEVVTSVEKTATGIVVKTNKGQYEITNGKDGKNGTPGTVVTIGENGNWFLDGTDTGVAAKGDKGDKGETGAAGQNGTNGDNGKDAEVKPEIKDGHLFINGEDCGVIAPKAIVAVVNGNTLTLTNVEGSMEPIVLNLKGGLTALVFRPGAVLAEDMQPLTLVTSDKNAEVLATRPGALSFKVFPSDFDVKNAKFFFSDSYKSAEAPVQYVDGSAKLAEGILTVNFLADTAKNVQKWHTSLDVELNGTTTSSEYFEVNPNRILNAQKTVNKKLEPNGTLKAKVNTTTGKFESKDFAQLYTFQYNKSLALADSAVTFVGGYLLDNYFEGIEYTLSVDNTLPANAEKILSIVDNKVVVNAEDWKGTAAVGKTGVVTVTSSVKGIVVAKANLTVKVVLKKAEPVVVTAPVLSVNYVDVVKGKTSTVKLALSEVLNAVEGGISKNELMANYSVDTDEAHTTYDVEGTNYTDLDVTFESEKDSLAFTIKSGKTLPENYKGAVKLTWNANDDNSSITVVFPYEISYTATLPEFNSVVVKDGTIFSHKNVADNRIVSFSDIFKENLELGTLYLDLPMVDSLSGTPVMADSTKNGNSFFFNVKAVAETFRYTAKKTVPQSAHLLNNKITGKGNDGEMVFLGTFTSATQTVFVDGVLVLPNGSEHYFPAFLKAEFASMYTSTKFADIKLVADEKEDTTVVLGTNFTIKHGEETVYGLGTTVDNNEIKHALALVENYAEAAAICQHHADSLTDLIAKIKDTVATATADSLAKKAEIAALEATYVPTMPSHASVAEFAADSIWNGLNHRYERETGDPDSDFIAPCGESRRYTDRQMRELWEQYKSTAAINNANVLATNNAVAQQIGVATEAMHAAHVLATEAAARQTVAEGELAEENGHVELAQNELAISVEKYQELLSKVAWAEEHQGSSIEFFIKRADYEEAQKYGDIQTPSKTYLDKNGVATPFYYNAETFVLREGATFKWIADEDKSRIENLVVPVTVKVTVKEGPIAGYTIEDAFNITLTSTLSK